MANSSLNCPLCDEVEESVSHIISCKASWVIWCLFYKWMGVEMTVHNKPMNHFLQHSVMFGQKKGSKMASTFWIAMVWIIWNARNEYVFNGKEFEVVRVFKEVKARVWAWCSIKEKALSQMAFKEWNSNPKNYV